MGRGYKPKIEKRTRGNFDPDVIEDIKEMQEENRSTLADLRLNARQLEMDGTPAPVLTLKSQGVDEDQIRYVAPAVEDQLPGFEEVERVKFGDAFQQKNPSWMDNPWNPNDIESVYSDALYWSPNRLLDEYKPDSSVTADSLATLIAFNDSGKAIYREDLLEARKSDLFYEIYTIGGDSPREEDYQFARQEAGIVLAAYQTSDLKLDPKDEKLLTDLAIGDLAGAVDKIRDKRMTGKYSFMKGAKKKNPYTQHGDHMFISAQEEDSIKILRENRPNRR